MFNLNNGFIEMAIVGTVLTVVFIFFLIATLLRLKNTRTQKAHEALRVINEERERTMATISIEIHNNVNQILSLAVLTLKMIQAPATESQQKYIADTEKLLEEAIRELRGISHSLNSDYLKNHGLKESLEEECLRLNNAGKLHCRLRVEGSPKAFSDEDELIFIRIAQEAIQNVLKHARAQYLDIVLHYEVNTFRMSIRDDGKGFAPDDELVWQGMGLQSIKKQSGLIEGCRADIQTQPGQGTTVTVTLQHPGYLPVTE